MVKKQAKTWQQWSVLAAGIVYLAANIAMFIYGVTTALFLLFLLIQVSSALFALQIIAKYPGARSSSSEDKTL